MDNKAPIICVIMGIIIFVLVGLLASSYDVQDQLKEKMNYAAKDINEAVSRIETEAEDAQSLFKQMAKKYGFDFQDNDVYHILLGLGEERLYPLYEAYETLTELEE